LFGFGSQGSIYINSTTPAIEIVAGGGSSIYLVTSALYRDPSAWYHIVIAVDTTQATSSNRVKLYVNGVQVTSFSSATYPSQNFNTDWNNTVTQYIGARGDDGVTAFWNGYITEIHSIDGQQLTPTSFGETDTETGVWKPKAYSGSYGTNGFYLKFADNSGTTSTTLGKDSSGNGNNWTPNNFSVTAGAGNDSLVDSPTRYGTDTGAGGEVRGNYCTLNPLSARTTTLTNGNLDASTTNGMCAGTIAVSSGKWYWEFTPTDSTAQQVFGIVSSSRIPLPNYPGATADSYGYYANGQKYNNGTGLSYGASFGNGNVIGVALDLDAGTLVFYKDGVSQGTAYSSISGTFLPAAGNAATNAWTANFGQRPFAYTAPSGFKALVTTNLPEPTIKKGGEYFNTVLYTGNGTSISSTQSISGVGFQPDFVWIKDRTNGVNVSWSHHLVDIVRGINSNGSAYLASNETSAETGANSGYGITSLNTDGFSLKGNGTLTNTNGDAYVAWNWKANGSGVTNTAGTITSTVSVNTTSGFSICTFQTPASGAFTFGHGIGTSPSMVIFKNRDDVQNWAVIHTAMPLTDYLGINTTNAKTTYGSAFSLSSTLVSVPSGFFTASKNHVAYCFAPISGFSSMGSYVGNGSTDGPFVYTGFRPRWIMFKIATSIPSGYGDWYIHDTVRNTINPVNSPLNPNTSAAENANNSSLAIDALSNGFKVRVSYQDLNNSGSTIIYAAFAENPFAYSLAR
jgi:hypothetical protein